MFVDEVDKAVGRAFVEGDGALDGGVAFFDALESSKDGFDILGSFFGFFLQAPRQEPVEVGRYGRLCGVCIQERHLGFALDNTKQEFFQIFCVFEVVVERQELIEDHEKAVDVASMVEFVVLSEGLFWGHIHRGPEQSIIACLEEALFGVVFWGAVLEGRGAL